MGTYFTALLNHNLTESDLFNLPDLLNSNWSKVQPFVPIIEGYPAPGTSPHKWEWDERDGRYAERRITVGTALLASHEFHGIVSNHVLSISHVVRWTSFLTEQPVRTKLRSVCRHIASVLGSNEIVYVPSGFLKPEGVRGLMYEGKTVADMIDWLLEKCGPPGQSFESFRDEELENWYYIENIKDPST